MEGERETTCIYNEVLLQSVWMVFLNSLCLEYVGIFSLAKNDGTVGPEK